MLRVASSHLPALQIAPRAEVALESRQFSASSSTDAPLAKVALQSGQFSASSCTDCSATEVALESHQFSASSSQMLRVPKLHYKVASSHRPARQILRVPKLHCKVASSQLPAHKVLHALKLHCNVQFSASSSQIAPRAKVVFFCTSRGAMCAGSAQVTLIELRRSYYTGRTSKEEQNPKNTTKPKQTPKGGSNLLRNSCGLGGIVRRGETGAMNSAKLSVYLVPQQTCKCLRRSRQRREFCPSDGRHNETTRSRQEALQVMSLKCT